MKRLRSKGFTLIELLVVIAIIAILAGMVTVGLPRVLEKAKIADVQSDFNAIRNALAAYAVDHKGSYPPAYGFRKWETTKLSDPATELDETNPDHYTFEPYLAQIGQYNNLKIYDRFQEIGGLDTDYDNYISRMEFSPAKDPVQKMFLGPLYPHAGGNPPMQKERSYIYAPVNANNFHRLKAVLEAVDYNGDGTGDKIPLWKGDTWPVGSGAPNGSNWPDGAGADRIKLLSAKYDSYVLIGVGPMANTCGLVCPSDESAFVNSLPSDSASGYDMKFDVYQALALRTYYLATRDLNENGELDFDFQARTRRDEANELSKWLAWEKTTNGMTNLPDWADDIPNATHSNAGPMIFKVGE